MPVNARRIAVQSLLRVHGDGGYSNVTLDAVLNELPKEGDNWANDHALISQLFYGVLERQITLDYVIGCHSSVKLKKIHLTVLEILRVGCYQLMYMDKIPASAAVNEAVKLTRSLKQEKSAAFVNAVLRAIDRSRGHWLDSLPNNEQGLSTQTSCPVEWINFWKAAYDYPRAEQLALSLNTVAPTYVRVNTLQTTTEQFEQFLQDAGVLYEKQPHLDACYRLEKAGKLKKLAQSRENWYYHQDTASQYCCAAFGATPGDRVADVCAAPGGKSFTLAQSMQNNGEILACDIYPAKCDTMEKRAEKLGITIMRTAVRDASSPCPEPLHGHFDRVLCDVPCSGLGVIRRKPEIRYKHPDEFRELPRLQYAILEQSAQMVRAGGVLQYSTCTLNPAENEEVTSRFLQEHPEFSPRILPLDACFESLGQKPGYEITLFPPVHGTDGFYIAGFIKTR